MRAPAGARHGVLPLLVVAAAAGSFAADRVAPEGRTVVVAALTTSALLVLVLVGGAVRRVDTTLTQRDPATRTGDRVVVSGLVACLATGAVSFAGIAVRDALGRTGPVFDRVEAGGRAEFRGIVSGEPRRVGGRWQTRVRIEAVDGHAARHHVALIDDTAPPTLGEHLVVVATARPVPDDGYGEWLARQHVVALLDPVGPVERSPAHPIVASTDRLRARLRGSAARHADPAAAALTVGLITGDVRDLPASDADAMRVAGLAHLTAVSGSNVALVLAGVSGLTHLVRLGARARWILLAVTVVWFALLTRFEPSVLRAGSMALLVLAALARGVAREATHLLAGAVLLLLLVDPRLAGSVGLALSATATLGVLVLAPAIARRLERRLAGPLARAIGVTVGAQLAVAPVLLATFGEVPLVGLAANLVSVPLAALASVLAAASAVLVTIAPDLASRGLALAAWPAQGILLVARRAALTPLVIDAWTAVRAIGAAAVIAALGVGLRRCGTVGRRQNAPDAREPHGPLAVGWRRSSARGSPGMEGRHH